MQPLLSVGIPTYNRAASLDRMLGELTSADPSVCVVVVDDGSTDGTPEVAARHARAGVRIVRHATNLGYPSALATLIEEADSEYLLLVNDDDEVMTDVLPALARWLAERRPSLARAQHAPLLDPPPPAAGGERPIAPAELRAVASHAPGLVFDVVAARASLTVLRTLLEEGNRAACFYPQVVVAGWLLATGGGWRWDVLVAREVDQHESGLRDGAGRPYWSPASRLEQAVAYQALFLALEESLGASSRHVAHEWRTHNLRTLYPALREAVGEVDASARGIPLDRSTLRQVAAGWARRLVRRR